MEPIRLMSDNTATDVWPARALLFGELVKLAAPAIKHYQSDLYHDAMWLSRYLKGASFAFFWSVDESGTTIGTEPIGLREHAYRVTVTNTRGVISMSYEAAQQKAGR